MYIILSFLLGPSLEGELLGCNIRTFDWWWRTVQTVGVHKEMNLWRKTVETSVGPFPTGYLIQRFSKFGKFETQILIFPFKYGSLLVFLISVNDISICIVGKPKARLDSCPSFTPFILLVFKSYSFPSWKALSCSLPGTKYRSLWPDPWTTDVLFLDLHSLFTICS